MKNVCIDPGHGGPGNSKEEKGACYAKFVESEFNLVVATDLAVSLSGMPLKWAFTREWEDRVSFSKRGKISRGCDFTICIHGNAHKLKHIRGAEIYYLKGDVESRGLAQVIADAMPKELWGRGRGARVVEAFNDPNTQKDDWLQAPINVLSPHSHSPAVLVECGYASNDADRKFMMDQWSRYSLVNAIRAGVLFGAKESERWSKKSKKC